MCADLLGWLLPSGAVVKYDNIKPLTPEQRAHLHEVTGRMYDEIKAGSPKLDIPIRSRGEAAFDLAYEALEAICAMAHEKEVVFYARRQLERIDVLRGSK